MRMQPGQQQHRERGSVSAHGRTEEEPVAHQTQVMYEICLPACRHAFILYPAAVCYEMFVRVYDVAAYSQLGRAPSLPF
jgi:hypothetical protein